MPIYDKYLTGTTRGMYLQYLADKDALDLSEEMALLRTELVKEIEKPKDKGHLRAVLDTADQIRKISGTISKNIENARGYIPISFLPFIQQEIVAILNREVKDPDVISRIRAALGRISLPANRVESGRVQKLIEQGRTAPSDT